MHQQVFDTKPQVSKVWALDEVVQNEFIALGASWAAPGDYTSVTIEFIPNGRSAPLYPYEASDFRNLLMSTGLNVPRERSIG